MLFFQHLCPVCRCELPVKDTEMILGFESDLITSDAETNLVCLFFLTSDKLCKQKDKILANF